MGVTDQAHRGIAVVVRRQWSLINVFTWAPELGLHRHRIITSDLAAFLRSIQHFVISNDELVQRVNLRKFRPTKWASFRPAARSSFIVQLPRGSSPGAKITIERRHGVSQFQPVLASLHLQDGLNQPAKSSASDSHDERGAADRAQTGVSHHSFNRFSWVVSSTVLMPLGWPNRRRLIRWRAASSKSRLHSTLPYQKYVHQYISD
jgi:hypothetical protein